MNSPTTNPCRSPWSRARAAGRFAALVPGAVLAVLLLPQQAWAQFESVPRMGITTDWVKKLNIPLDSQWEWIETATDRVFFATRLAARRRGDIVSMWIRVEYRDPQPPDNRLSVAERSEWDCANRRRAVRESVVHRWNNFDDANPIQAEIPLRSWEQIKDDTAGEALLDFACAIHTAAPRVTPSATPAPSGERPSGK